MPPFTIRLACGDDLREINSIYNEAVLNTTATFDLEIRELQSARAWYHAHGPAYPIFVAEENAQVIGWSSLSPFAPRPAYRFTAEDSIYIHQDFRGRGAGGALLRALLEAADALGYKAIIAKIAEHNEVSLALHHRAGFIMAGTLQSVGYKFGRWIDLDLLQRLLPAHPEELP